MKQGFAFEFDPPADWAEFKDGERFVFQGPAGEELIVSGAVVVGSGASSSYESIKNQLRENAISSMKHAVAVPEVAITAPLKNSVTAQRLHCWTLEAKTTDDSTIFLQAALEGEGGVLLVTFEAPHADGQRRSFDQFVNGVRSVGTQPIG